MGNFQSAPATPFEGWGEDESPQLPYDNSDHGTFHKNQQVPYPGGKYIGAYVSDPHPKGHPNEIELTVPALGKHKSFTVRFPKAAVTEEMNRTSDPLDVTINNDEGVPMPTPIGCGPCGLCCWSPTLYFQPRRVLASLFCWLNAFLMIYIFFAVGVLGAMGQLCSQKYVKQIEEGFTAQSAAPAYHAPSAAEAAPVYQAPAEAAANGYRLLSAYEAPGAAAAAGVAYSSAAAATAQYSAAEATEQYKPHSAYLNVAGYSEDFVGPACNRLVSFVCVWSCLMAICVSIYGCCVFRHWQHYSHVIGFYMACIFWMAFDFFSVGLIFAFDANNMHKIDDPMYQHHGRLLKRASNDLSSAYELEICACCAAFLMSYFYLIFGLNLWRYSGALVYDWNKGRPATVEKNVNRLAGDASRDFRLWRPKSRYYSEEFDNASSFGQGGSFGHGGGM